MSQPPSSQQSTGRPQTNSTSSDLFDEVLASQIQPSEVTTQASKFNTKRLLAGRLSASPYGKSSGSPSPQRKLTGKAVAKRDFGLYFGKQRSKWQYTFTYSPGIKQTTPSIKQNTLTKATSSSSTPSSTTESRAGVIKKKKKRKNVNTEVFEFQSDDEEGNIVGEIYESEEVLQPLTKKVKLVKARKGQKTSLALAKNAAGASPGKRGRKPGSKASPVKGLPLTQPGQGGVDFPVVKRGRGRPRKYPRPETLAQVGSSPLVSSPLLGRGMFRSGLQKSPINKHQQSYKQQKRMLMLQRKQQQQKRKWQRLQKLQKQQATPEAIGSPVKRGRGRPRKYPRVEASELVANVTASSPASVQQKMEEAGGTPVVKRGRGRPRKTPEQVAVVTLASPAMGVSPSSGSPLVKRGRGRPSKTPEQVNVVPLASPADGMGASSLDGSPLVKRGRGRPRKYPRVETPSQNSPVTLPSPVDGMRVSPSGGSPLVKRGRGRPRKYPRVETPGQVSHITFSSPDVSMSVSPLVVEISPATLQQTKEGASDSPLVKRGRGRPRKYPRVETSEQFADVTFSSPDDGIMTVSPSVVEDNPATQQESVDSLLIKPGRGQPSRNPKVETSEEVADFTLPSPAEEGIRVSPVVVEISPATQQQEEASTSPVVKRGRGRPRKYPRVETSKQVADVTSPSPADGVGESPSTPEKSPITQKQNKEGTSDSPVVKRGRGRPRKYPRVETPKQVADVTLPFPADGVGISPSTSESSPIIKQQNKEGTGDSPVVKRGRGRPRKYPRVEHSGKVVGSALTSPGVLASMSTPSPLSSSAEAKTNLTSDSNNVPTMTQGPFRNPITQLGPPTVQDAAHTESRIPEAKGKTSSISKAGIAGLSEPESEPQKCDTEEESEMEEVSKSQEKTEEEEEEEDPLPKMFKDKQERPSSQGVVNLHDSASAAKSHVVVGGGSYSGGKSQVTNAKEGKHERVTEKASEKSKASKWPTEESEQARDRSISTETSSGLKVPEKDDRESTLETNKEQTVEAPSVTREQLVIANGKGSFLSSSSSSRKEEPLAEATRKKEGEEEMKMGGAVTEPRHAKSSPPELTCSDEVFDVVAEEDEPNHSVPVGRRGSTEMVTKYTQSDTGTSHTRRNSDKELKAVSVPKLAKSATWPKPSQQSISSLATHKQNAVMVRNVRQAHECLEHGENLRFKDEVEYLLDNMRMSQPLSVRCLSTLNLASQCLKNDFCQQLRIHGLMNKILMLLKDALDYPPLSVSMAVLFYIITRDKVDCAELDRRCIDLLVGLLAKDEKERLQREEMADEEDDENGEALTEVMTSGKEARELERIKKKAKSVLSNCPVIPIKEKDRKQGETDGGDDEEEGKGGEDQKEVVEERKGGDEDPVGICPSDLSLGELACEALLSLTSSSGTSCNWLREEMRILGALDHIANKVIALVNSVRPLLQDGGKFQSSDVATGETRTKLQKIQRLLRLIENATFLSKANQTYITVFDGNLLVSKLCSTAKLLQGFLTIQEQEQQQQQQPDPGIKLLRSLVLEVLLMVFRVLLNVTHDNELGSHRVGEQSGVLQLFLGSAFKLPKCVAEEKRFDVLVLSMGLLINLMEHSEPNREHLFNAPMRDPDGGTTSPTGTALKDVIELFLSHHMRAEQATIDVPTPQRLSQLTPQSSPLKSPQAKKDLATRIKGHKLTKGYRKQGTKGSQDDVMEDEAEEGMEDKTSGEGEDDDNEEEEPASDPLVFSREEFDAALTQAGKHMEDSIIASYAALLLGVLAKHNNEFAKKMAGDLPEKNFSSLITVLKKFVSFMNITGSSSTRSGLDSVNKIIKHLETL